MDLRTGQVYRTESSRDAFKVQEGALDVFVIPREKGVWGRPLFILHAEKGETIPGMLFTDRDYIDWFLQFEATETCQLQLVENGSTRPLKKRFVDRVTGKKEKEKEFTMEQILVEDYLARTVRDDVLITRSEAHREKEREESQQKIRQMIRGETGKPGTDPAGPDRAVPKAPSIFAEGRDLPRNIFWAAVLFIIGGGAIWTAAGQGTLIIPAALLWLYFAGRGAIHMVICRRSGERAAVIQEKIYRAYYGSGSGDEIQGGRRQAYEVLRSGEILRGTMAAGSESIVSLTAAGLLWISVAALRPGSALAAALILAAAGLILYRGKRRHIRWQTQLSRVRSDGNLILLQAFSSIEKIRLSGAVEHVIRRYYTRKQEENHLEKKSERSRSAASVWIGILLAIAFTVATAFALDRAGTGFRETAAFLTGCALMGQEGLRGALRLGEAKAGERRLPGWMLQEKDEPEKTGSDRTDPEEETAPRTGDLPDGDAVLEMDRVSFAYDGVPACSEVSLQVRRGECLGIAGASGSGKTTLIKLLTGRAVPDSGEVRYAGRPMGAGEADALKREWGTVSQNDQLLTASIRDNLLMGARDPEKADIPQAVRDACLEEDLRAMPMGMDTLIREDGGNISVGQKQKILIARALVSDPRIIFFDEAESDLSADLQERIADNIRRRGGTMIIVSHQYPSIRKCDRIITMDQGRIVESGTPEELIRKEGRLFSLMSRQM